MVEQGWESIVTRNMEDLTFLPSGGSNSDYFFEKLTGHKYLLFLNRNSFIISPDSQIRPACEAASSVTNTGIFIKI